AAGPIDWAAARRHWAFQPVRQQGSGDRTQGSEDNPIDDLVLEKLKAAGLSFSPPADRRTLLRRVYFDLVGLPPTWAEVEAFEADRSPDAFAKVVDRLLSSPRYGERWGRHWLDVARFADTKDGVLMYGDDRIRPYAYTYRDYVIRSFNDDLPFDRFVHEQLAADLIEPKVEPSRLAALGFLTLGRMFDNNIHDILDDKIDTTSRALLALTVSCARCHDHKYDPVPMADYYSLYGVFASSEAPLVPPLLDPGCRGPEDFEKKYAAKQREVQEMLDKQYVLQTEAARGRVGDYLVHVVTTQPDPLESAIYFLSLAPEDLRPPIVARWRNYLVQRATADDVVFGPWHDLFALPAERLAAEAPGVIERWKRPPSGQVNPLVLEALAKATLNTRLDVARTYGDLLKRVYEESKAMGPKPDPAREQLLAIVTGPDSPAYFPKSHTWKYMSRAEKDAFGGKQQELDRLAVKEPNAPPRAMALADSPELYDPRVFVRGNPTRPADAVPRRFLAVLAGVDRKPFSHGSGRLDMAKAITDPANPLTARVIANRVWMHHFGEPLVETPNDFGLRCPPPAQLALLDHLAACLVADGWSLKKLHRQIVLSRAYRQASFNRPDARKLDPDNKLYWRMNRRRLDLEAMRDGMLAAAGRLEERLYGRPVDALDARNQRRTVYGLVDRQSLPGLFRTFDFASPDQSAERRPLTTVPQQALFAMNAPFVHEQARALAARCADPDPAARVSRLYRTLLLRDPDPNEMQVGLAFVEAAVAAKEKSPLGAWDQYAQVLLLTNEFMFVD
ncbi:MAG TPA: DUF1549 and DUF1553 domain-containing protein, partial [Gemmataceae bacterium]|nr:DUF1549 and DUF1553 domain-containing protein [Gemmataceae bacterium]